MADFYRARGDTTWETIAASELDALGSVHPWQELDASLHQVLLHLAADTVRHAGHLNIRERSTAPSAV